MSNDDKAPRLHREPRPGVPGIVHLGIGAFFRAHGALYLEEAMERSSGDWRVTGVSLQRPDQRDKLAPQGYAYTAVELQSTGPKARIVEVIDDILVAREAPEAVLAAMARPETRIVSLTVTEKGYCHIPSTGKLDTNHPDIQHDLAHPHAPKTAAGFIAGALVRRKAAGLRPFTVLSCDNLVHNGTVAAAVVTEFARHLDPALADWIVREGAFPSTMVDRIVPATRPDDLELVRGLTGFEDLSPVLHEPFRQWVIEDRFVDGDRPDFGGAGAELVADVTPFEQMKLRCLNGAHSALAYLGSLAGHETVSAASSDPQFAGFLNAMWQNEVIPALEQPEGVDARDYVRALLTRFTNPNIRHLTSQIAMDGSQKLPQRILSTIMLNRAASRPSPALTLVVAAWILHARGTDPTGRRIEVRDPLAAQFRSIGENAASTADLVSGFLSVEAVFPPKLAAADDFRTDVTNACALLLSQGAVAAIGTVLEAR